MLLSIIILSYKNPGLIRLCLNSLAKAMPKDFDYEVIVVDNASTLGTRNVINNEFTDKFTNLKLVPIKENAGYTKGVNEGIKTAEGDYIFYVNYDVIFMEGMTEKLLDYLKERPEIGLIGPELINFNGTHQDSCFRFYTPMTILYRRIPYLPAASGKLAHFTMKDKDMTQIREVDWLSGAAFMFSRNALNKVGLLDENLFHYFSDVDWSRRFWENGYKVIYYPSSKIYHYHGQGSRGRFGVFDIFINKETRWHIADAIKYFRKYGTSFKSFCS